MNQKIGSTALQKIDNVFSMFSDYRLYKAGLIKREEYIEAYDSMVDKAILLGLTEDDCYLTTRFIFNEFAFVQGVVSSLGLLAFDEDGVYKDFLRVRDKVQRLFFHSKKTSYTFPEEELLMYSMVSICQPKKAIFLGAYYGYWAIWAALADENLYIILIDIDPVVCSLAEENVRNFGLSGRVEVLCDDAASYMRKRKLSMIFWLLM